MNRCIDIISSFCVLSKIYHTYIIICIIVCYDISQLLDHHNAEEVKKFEQEHPYISVRRIDGTDRQGEYKSGGDLNAAHLAMRIKMREVFIEYANLNAQTDWLCYFDDDMDAQVTVLKEDLVRLKPSCSPNCWIGDSYRDQAETPAMGAWCMQRELAERVSTLLDTNNDQDLKWDGTDDGGFYAQVMKPIGVSLVSSANWYSQIHHPMPERNSRGFKKINDHDMNLEWKKDKSFMEVWWPTAAVFNDKYGYATQAA